MEIGDCCDCGRLPRERRIHYLRKKRGQKTRVQDGAAFRKPRTVSAFWPLIDTRDEPFFFLFFLLDWHECFLTAYRQSNLIHTPKPPLITKGLFRASNQSGLYTAASPHTAFDASIGHDSPPLSSRLLRNFLSSSFSLSFLGCCCCCPCSHKRAVC